VSRGYCGDGLKVDEGRRTKLAQLERHTHLAQVIEAREVKDGLQEEAHRIVA